MSRSAPKTNPAGRIAASFLDSLAASDADAIAEMWTDDAVLEFPFAPEGFPPSVEGQPAIEKYFRDALAVVTPIDYPDQVVTPLADPDACLIEFGSRLTVGDNPTVFENKYITIVRVRDGKIAHFKEHYDSVKRLAGFPSGEGMAGSKTAARHSVVVHLSARQDAADRLADLLAEGSARAAKDPGCVFYRVLRSSDDGSRFVIFEAWDSKADFGVHLASGWVVDINQRMQPLLDGAIDAHAYRELSPKHT